MTDLDILRGARARIALPENWLQGSFAMDAGFHSVWSFSPEACRFCGWAALGATAGRGHSIEGALAYLVAVIPGPSFARWNDDDARTHAEVLAAYGRAIALAQTGRRP